jgi:hypothetical protein
MLASESRSAIGKARPAFLPRIDDDVATVSLKMQAVG